MSEPESTVPWSDEDEREQMWRAVAEHGEVVERPCGFVMCCGSNSRTKNPPETDGIS